MLGYAEASEGDTGAVKTDAFSRTWWNLVWDRVKYASVIARSQRDHPERWARFFNEVAPLWGRMMAHGQSVAHHVVEALIRFGLINAHDSVLDVGCGPGHLALALVRRGCHVTAVDQSPAMIALLRREAQNVPPEALRAECLTWERIPKHPDHDVAMAAFFPPVFSFQGLLDLETCARRTCLTIVSSGTEQLPFRQALWRALMSEDPPRPDLHLMCAANALWTMQRKPFMHHLQWSFNFDEKEDRVIEFYTKYFAIFDVPLEQCAKTLEECLAPYRKGRCIRAQGRMQVSLLWWHVGERLDCRTLGPS